MCHARRVLVVEDTPAVCRLLARALADEGYTVHAAVHGTHALQLLEQIAPCLILLDLRKPVVDGWAFAQAYRARDDSDADLVAITAEPFIGPLDDNNPVHVARKPFDLERLLPPVGRWVDAHAPRMAWPIRRKEAAALSPAVHSSGTAYRWRRRPAGSSPS
jgi:two-component system, chemotaxis family, chemotaxis protein CheY